MLDRGIAHALAQVTDPIIMVGPELKMVYANLAARKLTQDKPAKWLDNEAMRAAQAQMRAGKAQLPLQISIDLGDANPTMATVFDWRSIGGFILIAKSGVESGLHEVDANAAYSFPGLLKSGLFDELDRHFGLVQERLGTVAKGEGESAAEQAGALRRSISALLELKDAIEASPVGGVLSAATLIGHAWKDVAPLALERAVEVSVLVDNTETLEIGRNALMLPWAFAEGLAFLVRRAPAGAASRPWRIEIAAYRAGNDTVISAVSIGRVAPNDAARRTVLASATRAASIQSIPPGFGTGLPLARAILVSIGGRLEWLSEDEEVGKLLFRFPGASA